eukprot:6214403-Pleurochrysis_carterae.AAC.1
MPETETQAVMQQIRRKERLAGEQRAHFDEAHTGTGARKPKLEARGSAMMDEACRREEAEWTETVTCGECKNRRNERRRCKLQPESGRKAGEGREDREDGDKKEGRIERMGMKRKGGSRESRENREGTREGG